MISVCTQCSDSSSNTDQHVIFFLSSKKKCDVHARLNAEEPRPAAAQHVHNKRELLQHRRPQKDEVVLVPLQREGRKHWLCTFPQRIAKFKRKGMKPHWTTCLRTSPKCHFWSPKLLQNSITVEFRGSFVVYQLM